MNITKYEHACLDIREGDSRLVIDPGVFSSSLTDFANIDAVVVTHIHGDHFDPKKLEKVIAQSPKVRIFTTQQVINEFSDHTELAQPGQEISIGDIKLEFSGDQHAEIDPKTPLVQNVGVLVNQKLYYPGDSFNECPKSFTLLAVPASAPWLRIGQTIPIIENSKCTQVFPTHNALLSEIGHSTTNNWLQKFAERSDKKFKYMKPGDSIEV